MTTALASQAGLIGLGASVPVAQASQAGLIALGVVVPVNACSQAGMIVLGRAAPHVTHRCQLWIINRTDGVILRFTSHDQDVLWGDEVYEACNSLSESASEQSSDQGSVGNIELAGILSSDAITESDLYAGRYDDAFIEVWQKSWDDETDTIKRIAAGWAGKASQGQDGFQTEVLGPGARLLQRPLLDTVTAACRFKFGDLSTCGVDADALALNAVAVTAASSRNFFVCDAVDPGGSAQWNRGKVRWTSGLNHGTICKVMTVDFITGVIILWQPAGFTPLAGDTFDLLPGCDLAFTGGCAAYANKTRNGGYPTVPGTDAISQVPNVKS